MQLFPLLLECLKLFGTCLQHINCFFPGHLLKLGTTHSFNLLFLLSMLGLKSIEKVIIELVQRFRRVTAHQRLNSVNYFFLPPHPLIVRFKRPGLIHYALNCLLDIIWVGIQLHFVYKAAEFFKARRNFSLLAKLGRIIATIVVWATTRLATYRSLILYLRLLIFINCSELGNFAPHALLKTRDGFARRCRTFRQLSLFFLYICCSLILYQLHAH